VDRFDVRHIHIHPVQCALNSAPRAAATAEPRNIKPPPSIARVPEFGQTAMYASICVFFKTVFVLLMHPIQSDHQIPSRN
jgi:hypothetical protein